MSEARGVRGSWCQMPVVSEAHGVRGPWCQRPIGSETDEQFRSFEENKILVHFFNS